MTQCNQTPKTVSSRRASGVNSAYPDLKIALRMLVIAHLFVLGCGLASEPLPPAEDEASMSSAEIERPEQSAKAKDVMQDAAAMTQSDNGAQGPANGTSASPPAKATVPNSAALVPQSAAPQSPVAGTQLTVPNAGTAMADADAGAPPPPASTADQCRSDFEACWTATGNIRMCAEKAQPCGLFPDGPDSAVACANTMQSCFALAFYDYAGCCGQAEKCGLLREGAGACAERLMRCIGTSTSFEAVGQCFESAKTCGLFPVVTTMSGAPQMPGAPKP